MISPKTPQTSSSLDEISIDYSKLFPVITGMLIVLGISRLMLYYGYFGIRILSFLEFGEIITSFLDIILTIITSSLFAWILLNIYSRKNKLKSKLPIAPSDKQNKEQYEAYLHEKQNYLKEKKKLVRKYLFLAIASFLLLLVCIIMSLGNYKMIIIVAIVFAVVFTLTFLFTIIYFKQKTKLIKDLCQIAIVFAMAEGFIIYITTSEYYRTKYDKKHIGTKITFNNEIQFKDSSHLFTSDSLNFYIGKTNNYIFIHHTKEDITSVYPMSTVMQIDFANPSSKK